MEHLSIQLDQPELFDQLAHGGLPCGNDLQVVTKPKATAEGKPAVVIAFSVQLPDGKVVQAQVVTTVALFQMAAAAMRGRYGG